MKIWWASVLLHDNKIKFWHVSPYRYVSVDDYYKDFMCNGETRNSAVDNPRYSVETTAFIEREEITRDLIFDILAPRWFNQWKLVEGYKGSRPYPEKVVSTKRPSRSKYIKGAAITSIDDVMNHDYIYYNHKVYHKGWFCSWPVRIMKQYIENHRIFSVIKKESKEES